MTDYLDVPTIFTGDWIDAAWINQYIGDNFRALKQGLATTGDVPYAVDGNTIAALSKPSVASFFKMQSSGSPVYIPATKLPGGFHVSGANYSDSIITTTSTSYVYTGIAFNFILEEACTIFAIAFGMAKKNTAAFSGYVAISIDGTVNPNEANYIKSAVDTPFMTSYLKTSVPAGARNVSLYYRTTDTSDWMGIVSAQLFAMAFVQP